jgi:hypothetical protein
MSYGWAVLVVIVLGIVLFNLGVFNPNSAQSASGFSVFRPQSWSFTAVNSTTSNATLAVTNVAGIDLVVQINGTSGILLSKPNCLGVRDSRPGGCGANSWCAMDEQGNTLSAPTGAAVIPAGGTIILNVMAFGNGTAGYTGCGGLRGQSYRWRIQYVQSTDGFNINHADTGFVNGNFQ